MSYAIRLDFPPSVNTALPDCPGVYEIRNVRNGYRYIGSGKSVRRRWATHLSFLRAGRHHNPRLQRVWNKYGEGVFEIAVIEHSTVEGLIAAEQRWLDSTNAASRRDYYNFLPIAGSRKTAKASRLTRLRMSRAQKGRTFSTETRHKMRLAKLGRKLTDEHRRKIGLASKGKALPPRSEAFRWACRKLSPEQLTELLSLREQGWSMPRLSLHLGIGVSTVHRILNGQSYASAIKAIYELRDKA